MDQSYKYDVDIAKNYLNEKKLKDSNRIVTMHLDYAELQVEKLNAFLQFNGKEILHSEGKISASVAQELAYKEYDKFKVRQDRLYKSDYDNFLNEARMIEDVSDKIVDMHQKREMRKNKKMNEDTKSFPSTSINWFPGHMAKTKRELKERINLIDIIYEVLDARMPISSKMKDMDDILNGKPKIIVMTKKDLCDIPVTNKWIKYYESKGSTVLLMDLTNNDDYKKLIKITHEVMNPIQEKRKAKGLKNKEIKIGVIGIPNVGKSTLINKLAGRKVASTGNKPGITKQINWLKTNNGFLLLDTPGILWPRLDNNEEALNLASTASIKTEVLNITDIGGYIISFLKNYYPHILEEKYNIQVQKDPQEIFFALAEKFNYFEKDGEIDYEKVSQKIYNDVVSGAIKGVTFDLWK